MADAKQQLRPHGVVEGEILWHPSREFAAGTNLARYMAFLDESRNLFFADYEALWQWSVMDIEAFWASLWDFFDIRSDTPFDRVLDTRRMPGARWFVGSRVNFAEHMLRPGDPGEAAAIYHQSEMRPFAVTTRAELRRQVRIVATRLRAMGLEAGDRIVSYMPNLPETVVAMLATVAIGGVWSSAAPEFGVKTVIERFAQIEPKAIFVADGYRFGGKDFARGDDARAIVDALPSLRHVVWLPCLGGGAIVDGALPWAELVAGDDPGEADFGFERVAHDHPLWVVFSSGTTGLPKAIVHSHVGALMELNKLTRFHFNMTPGSVMLFYTTTGWVMWNILLGALLAGAAVVLYDGSPVHPSPDALWALAARARATCFGASPTYVQILERQGIEPGRHFDLSCLDSIILSGSPATPETFGWFYRAVKADLWVTSQSGGTEICSGFVGGVPLLPVRAGEIQGRLLGMDVHAWSDDGREVSDEVGELVVTSPFPSMPLRFWGDDGDRRYRESYFDVFEGVWRHGDFIKINARGGCFIYGRSDSTLNRHGIRIGTSEVYRAVEKVEGVEDSLIVCCELSDGGFYMPLFLRLSPGLTLDDRIRQAVTARLRSDCSPRHVPDEMLQVPLVPYTLTGKKMEIPVRKLLMGWPPEHAASRDAMARADALDWYVTFAAGRGLKGPA